MHLALRPNECMVRAGLLVGLTSGFAALGHWQVAAGIGVFAAVQLVTIAVGLLQGRP